MTLAVDAAMPFALTGAHHLLRESVRGLAERHIAPRAADIDETEEYPEDIFALMKDQVLLGIYLPEEYGGAGMGVLGACIAIEEIARVCSNSPLFLSVFLLAT
ncbi:MAG: acyl-CoA dehydrogenase family protein, partial [Nitrospinota bacterium]|nr:acyl-CoA dehydrogenase family protein [Nitrospinota bacterium]